MQNLKALIKKRFYNDTELDRQNPEIFYVYFCIYEIPL